LAQEKREVTEEQENEVAKLERAQKEAEEEWRKQLEGTAEHLQNVQRNLKNIQEGTEFLFRPFPFRPAALPPFRPSILPSFRPSALPPSSPSSLPLFRPSTLPLPLPPPSTLLNSLSPTKLLSISKKGTGELVGKLHEEVTAYEQKIAGGKREEQALWDELAALKETYKEVSEGRREGRGRRC
jgi:hypothetical protein